MAFFGAPSPGKENLKHLRMSLAQLQILSPCFIVGSALLFLGLERKFPYNSGQRAFRDGFWVDLIGYGVVQSYLMGVIISALIGAVDRWTGLSHHGLVSHWPIALQVAFFILTHDLNTYLIHRAQHRSKVLWRTHEAHHSCTNVDWLSGIRSHSLEILMYQTVEFLPVVLLGASPKVPLYKAMANAVYGMYIHSNLKIRMGKLLWVINGPELHRWHHANDDQRAYDKNFATKFTVWDRLLGTWFDPGENRAADYGPSDGDFPEGWVSQHLFAFRPLPAMKEATQA